MRCPRPNIEDLELRALDLVPACPFHRISSPYATASSATKVPPCDSVPLLKIATEKKDQPPEIEHGVGSPHKIDAASDLHHSTRGDQLDREHVWTSTTKSGYEDARVGYFLQQHIDIDLGLFFSSWPFLPAC
ncbi:hypothetical protein U9M48_003905 [Paspalum notatum var. saurae]|uniref:Uncharacterized protein n=1 Tax=Paspalum notatum var. saurae TaxID=547442 RepID=A0AAQ3PS49_PASNO